MRVVFILFTACFLMGFKTSGHHDLIKLRGMYYHVAEKHEDIELLNEFINNKPLVKASLLEAYKGMYYMIKADVTWNPYHKLNYFNQGKTLLEQSIQNDPTESELKFLRFCIQTNIPAFLHYNHQITDDKNDLIRQYPMIKDLDLKNRIKTYFINCKYIPLTEKQILK